MNETSAEYQRGYTDAMEQAREDLGAILRLAAFPTNEDNEELLSDAKVREIFAGVFGVKACDDEFGPEPSGAGVRSAIQERFGDLLD